MDRKRERNMGVYIHIPFCISKCYYCDFLSFPASVREQELYLEGLLGEIKDTFGKHPEYQADTVFVGGGTPSVLPGEWMERILQEIPGGKRECTVEVNPGTVTEEKLRAYGRAGVNRLSIGLQSFSNRELKAIGRIHTVEEFRDTFHMARDLGFSNINIDLMSALPGQTQASYGMGLKEAAELGPEHISAYSLIIEEGTRFYQCCPELPGEEEERRMYRDTSLQLSGCGYERYEISNYARKGYECRHNVGYWRRRDYLGFGLGASSLMDNVRWKRTDSMEDYLKESKKGRFTRRDVEELTPKEQQEEFMFLGLRMEEGVSSEEFESSFGISLSSVYGKAIDHLLKDGLLEWGKRLKLTERGIDVSNHVLAYFLQE